MKVNKYTLIELRTCNRASHMLPMNSILAREGMEILFWIWKLQRQTLWEFQDVRKANMILRMFASKNKIHFWHGI